jgi:eukaryotic-like serine/threonine-protein kinase
MTPERWQIVKTVVAEALERTPEGRRAYLDRSCADPTLRKEVESLIAAHERGESSFLEGPAIGTGPLQNGMKLGPYTILGSVGSGGMGEVYRARDSRLDRTVAIKILPAEFSADSDRLNRFQREARSASALNHPNIVTIYELGQDGSIHYIAMELVEGKTLRDRLSARSLPIREAIEIAAQIAEGLAKAHEAGIAHRDIKPANLMVSGDGFVKILDFGLAKVAPAGGDPTKTRSVTASQTLPGMIMGTPEYMSPEQAVGGELDFRSDQFSFGLVLYEMVTGKRAFRRSTPAEMLVAIIREQAEPVAALAPDAPAPLCWAIERCLAKEPDKRYVSTRELARELAAIRERFSERPDEYPRPADGAGGTRERSGSRQGVAAAPGGEAGHGDRSGGYRQDAAGGGRGERAGAELCGRNPLHAAFAAERSGVDRFGDRADGGAARGGRTIAGRDPAQESAGCVAAADAVAAR